MDTVAMQFFSAVLAYSGESSSSPVRAVADDFEKLLRAGEGSKYSHTEGNTSV